MPIVHILAAAAGAAVASMNSKDVCCKSNSQGCKLDYESDIGDFEICDSISPVLIDTSGRMEEAWGLFMALEAHKEQNIPIHIEAITCVNGMIPVDSVVGNVSKVLSVSNVENIRLFRGAESSLVSPNEKASFNTNRHPKAEKEHAVSTIIDCARYHKGNLRILALGPLTNLALAVKLCPAIRDYAKDIFIVGGNHQVGLAKSAYNIAADAEAAHIVFSTFHCPIYVMPMETCLKLSECSSLINSSNLRETESKQMNFLNKIESTALNIDSETLGLSAFGAAAFINPEIITKMHNRQCQIELHGNHTRGLMLVDQSKSSSSNVNIISDIDVQEFEKMLVWSVGGKSYE